MELNTELSNIQLNTEGISELEDTCKEIIWYIAQRFFKWKHIKVRRHRWREEDQIVYKRKNDIQRKRAENFQDLIKDNNLFRKPSES